MKNRTLNHLVGLCVIIIFDFVSVVSPYSTEPQIIQTLQRKFHSGCVFIVQTEVSISAEKTSQYVWKRLMELNIQTTIVHHLKFPHCRRNRPLNVLLYSSKHFLQEVMVNISFTNAKWILFTSHNNSLENMFRDVNIPLDCEFLVAQMKQDSVVQLREVYRVHPSLPLEVHLVGNWSSAHLLQWTKTYIYRRRSNLRGFVFRAAWSDIEPITVIKAVGKNKYRVEGFFGKVWSTLEEKLNFSTAYLEPQLDWGYKNNGTWTGMVGRIIRKEVDVGIAAFSMSSDRVAEVDFLSPLFRGLNVIYIRKPDEFWPNWITYLSPFKWQLWICISAAALLLSIGLMATNRLAHRYGREDPRWYSFSDSVICVFASFCSQGQDSTPVSWSCRTVYFTSSFMGVVILASYSAALISFLTVQPVVLPFRNLKELLDDGTYKFFIPKGYTLSYFRDSADDVPKTIYTKMLAPIEDSLPIPYQGLRRVCDDPKFAFMTSSYVAHALQKQEQIRCKLTTVPETALLETLSIIVTKGSPYRSLFNYHLQGMKHSGTLQRIRENHWYGNLTQPEEVKFEVSLQTVSPIFIVLTTGVLIAFLLLLSERRLLISQKWR